MCAMHGVRSVAPEQLRHERAHVAKSATELRPAAEGPEGAVRRQVVRADVVGDDDELVAALRERAQLGHGRAEDRVLRVHGLRHEDEAHQCRASARVRSTSERTRVA